MKISEIRGLGVAELQTKKGELAEELFRLKIRHAGGQLESTASLGLSLIHISEPTRPY